MEGEEFTARLSISFGRYVAIALLSLGNAGSMTTRLFLSSSPDPEPEPNLHRSHCPTNSVAANLDSWVDD